MTAWTRDIFIEQGATFTLGFVAHEITLDGDGEIILDSDDNPVPGPALDLTDCVARMQIRKSKKDDTVLIEATSADIADDPGAGQRIVLEADGVQGRVDIVLTDTDTDKMAIPKGVYDLEIAYPIQPGELRPFTIRVLEGTVSCNLNVTRVLDTSDEAP